MAAQIELIVGLGNPGAQYAGTRHNAGEDFVRELARQAGASLKAESRFHGETTEVLFAGHRLRLLVPTTFMNRSGQSVAGLARFYRIEPPQMLIAHDELDIPPGSARFKFDGGHGGHNGLRDIIPLSRAPAADREAIAASIDEAIRALPLLLDGDTTKAMTRLHSFNGAVAPDAGPAR